MPCFLLVQLGALKIDAHPWLIQCSPFGCFTTFVLKSTLSVPDFHGEHNRFIFEMCLVNYWLLVLHIVLGQVISALLSDFFYSTDTTYLRMFGMRQHRFCRRNIWCVLLRDVKGLVPYDHLRKFGTFSRPRYECRLHERGL